MRVKCEIIAPNQGYRGGNDLSTHTWPIVKDRQHLAFLLMGVMPMRPGVKVTLETLDTP